MLSFIDRDSNCIKGGVKSQAKIIRTFSQLETGSDLSFSMLIQISIARLADIELVLGLFIKK